MGGVDIQDVSISWDDQFTGEYYDISNINMNIGELVYGDPIQLTLGFDATSTKPQLSATVALSGNITYNLSNERYDISPLQIDGTITGPNVPEGEAVIHLAPTIAIDLIDETLAISDLDFNALGTQINGIINAGNIRSVTPSVRMEVKMTGADLATFVRIAEVESLATQIKNQPDRRYRLVASVDADMQRGDVTLSGLDVRLLGATIQGDVSAKNIQSSTPEFKGSLNEAGPDLPMLMQVIGQFQGSSSPLIRYGKQLSSVSRKAFIINAGFDADLKGGDINLPTLAVDALGIKLQGNLTAKGMQKTSGNVSGKLSVSCNQLKEVLVALEQQDLADVLQSVNLNAGVSGNRSNLILNPVDLKLVFSGKQIPNSPVDLLINANAVINLDSGSLVLNDLVLSGLGLNIKGNVNTSKVLTSPEFNGQLEVEPFNLRKLMGQLNKEVPDTAGKKTSKKFH